MPGGSGGSGGGAPAVAGFLGFMAGRTGCCCLRKENDGRAGSLLATRILFQEDDVIVGIASPPFSAFTNCIIMNLY